ncbi:MAG: hypothetical protein LBI67_02065 [Treponema sp.]|jgi:uncharacterized integral membrane protein|nr:hypothetical protein [Treponema sp.]
MPWRLIGLILILAVLLAFIAVNLEHTCDISFGFASVADVPVYVTVFASFVLGMLMSVPFLVSFALRKKPPKAPKKDNASPPPEIIGGDGGPYGID